MMGTNSDQKGLKGTDEEHVTKEEQLVAELMTTRAKLYKANVMIMELTSRLSKEPWSLPEPDPETRQKTIDAVWSFLEKFCEGKDFNALSFIFLIQEFERKFGPSQRKGNILPYPAKD